MLSCLTHKICHRLVGVSCSSVEGHTLGQGGEKVFSGYWGARRIGSIIKGSMIRPDCYVHRVQEGRRVDEAIDKDGGVSSEDKLGRLRSRDISLH